MQVSWDIDSIAFFDGAHASKRSLHNSMLQVYGAQFQGRKESCVFERLEAWWCICFGHFDGMELSLGQ